MITVLVMTQIIKITHVNVEQQKCVGYIVREGSRWRIKNKKEKKVDIILSKL